MKRSRSLLAAMLAGWLTSAAVAGAAPEAPSRALRFDHLTNRDGLSHNTVFGITQDDKGFLWFATKVGLNRYDGYTVKTYTHDPYHRDTLTEAFVRVVVKDRSGKLWLGTYNGGVNVFDPETETFADHRSDPEDPTSLSSNDVRAIFQDRHGAVWIGTGWGLNLFDPETRSFKRYLRDDDDPSSLSHNDVRAIVEDRTGSLWIGTNGGGLNRFDPGAPERGLPGFHGASFKRFQHRDDEPGSLVDNRVRALLADRFGHLWIGTSGGLDRFDPATGKFRHFRNGPDDPASLASDQVRSLFEDRGGDVWVGTTGGLHRFLPGSDRCEVIRPDPSDPAALSDADVRAIFEDRSGGLWFGTYNGGVNRFDPDAATFRHYRHDPEDLASLSADDVRAIYQDDEERLWVGTYDGGLNRMDRALASEDPSHGLFVRYRHDPDNPESLADDRISCILEDRSGVLWLGMYNYGLSRFDPETERFVHYRSDYRDPSSLSNDLVRYLYEDRVGRLWIGTRGGLNLFDRTSETFTHFRHDPEDPESLSNDSVFAIYQDASGLLWLGTYGGGLNRFDPGSGEFVHYRHDPANPDSGLSHDAISSLHEDRRGWLWIGTYGGSLDRFNPATETFEHYADRVVLPDNVIFGILEDRPGFLWLSTNRGLVRFDPATNKWTLYDLRDGLQGVGFNPGAFFKTPDGEMFFGGYGGLNAFYPEDFKDNAFVPPVVLTAFKVFDEEVPSERSSAYLGEIELSYQQNFFSFEYAALNFRRPEKNRYLHMLEGLDEEWIDPGDRRYASYTQVPPGEYFFRVKGSNNDGLWNEEGLSVRIRIRPPWFRTGWSYALASLLAIAAVVGAFFGQRRRLRRQAAEELRALDLRRQQEELAATEQWARELEEELTRSQQLEQELERIIAQLETKTGELERFTYTVSHDLKSPLFTIQGFLGMLESDLAEGKTEKALADLDRIRGAARQMAEWLDELLKLSRIGRIVHPPQEVSLYDLAREAADLAAGRIQERSVEVVIDPELPVVSVDRQRMLEVLQNLIDNAAKFMGSEPEPRIEVSFRQDGDERVYFVRDNGIGIDPVHHDKIFGLFQRLDTQSAGTGIGLVLVKRIVEVHGGRIWVESEGTGRGTTVCFTLPQEPPPSS